LTFASPHTSTLSQTAFTQGLFIYHLDALYAPHRSLNVPPPQPPQLRSIEKRPELVVTLSGHDQSLAVMPR